MTTIEATDDFVAAVKTQRYVMPVTLQDLPPAEALHQIFDSLQHLNTVVSDVFGRLHARVAEERGKINGIVSRVGRVQGLVSQISNNVNKATTVHSITKYPADKKLPRFVRVNGDVEPHALEKPTHSKYHLKQSQRAMVAERADTLALFSTLTQAPEFTQSSADNTAEGLGRLPAYLPSISSILLFNSDENPYKKYISINNLEGVGGTDREKDDAQLAAAPTSLIDGAQLPTFAGVDFGYTPHLGEVPTFDLPANLPLAKVADINFGDAADAVASIAPSIATLPALPSVEDWQQQYSSTKKKQPKTAKPPSSSSTPGGGDTVVLGGTDSSAPPAAPPVPANVPAAPPAPPAPPAAPPAPAAIPAGVAKALPPEAASAPPRNALLDQIRNPGLKLRKVTDSDREKKKPKKEASGGGGGGGGMDMMSALRNALMVRRQATSGKLDASPKKKSAKSAKAAASIPSVPSLDSVPEPRHSADAEDFSDDDWN